MPCCDLLKLLITIWRKQITICNSKRPITINIKREVPQGSVLGTAGFPSLYKCHTRERKLQYTYLYVYLLADGTTILTWGETRDTAYKNAEKGLLEDQELCSSNKLHLNQESYKILLTTERKPEEERKTVEFLGIHVWSNLNYSHRTIICNICYEENKV